MERVGEEQNNLIMAVEKTANEKAEEIETELQTYVSTSQNNLRNISKSSFLFTFLLTIIERNTFAMIKSMSLSPNEFSQFSNSAHILLLVTAVNQTMIVLSTNCQVL